MNLETLPTMYSGCTFRSRLEARWAICFDALRIPWQYEPEGYRTAGGNYLPDFALFGGSLHAEVKPALAVVGERDWRRWASFVRHGRWPLALLFGPPTPQWYMVLHPPVDSCLAGLGRDFIDFGTSACKGRPWEYHGGPFLPPVECLADKTGFTAACLAARRARFDRGLLAPGRPA